MSDIFTTPDLLYETVKTLDYLSIVNICSANASVYSICLNDRRIRSVLYQRYIDHLIEINKGLFGAFRSAVRTNQFNVANELINRGAHPSSDDGELLFDMFKSNNWSAVNYLINLNISLSPYVQSSFGEELKNASTVGNVEKVKSILSLGLLTLNNPTFVEETNIALIRASTYGHLPIVNLLLLDSSRLIDPSYNFDSAVNYAAEKGHLDVLNRLLQDPRVFQHHRGADTLKRAIQHKQLEIVDRLLRDTRVNPADDRNDAFITAVRLRRLEIVKRLLQDPRINPSDQHNLALAWTKGGNRREKYKYRQIAKLIKSDPRYVSDAELEARRRPASPIILGSHW